MKKLIYNENKKEIDVVELGKTSEEEEKKSRKVKTCLENNKIFFEVFSYVLVGIMGIVISFVGWKTNKRSADIYQRQLEILDNDREPYFSLSYETINEERNENGYNIINKYTIKNEGGLINDAYLSDIKSCMIICVENDENKYKYYLDGKFSIPNEQYIYNLENKKFSFYGQENYEFLNFIEALEKDITFLFNECDVDISVNDYIKINYVNYKNERYNKVYEFSKDGIFTKLEDDKEKVIVLGGTRYNETDKPMEIAIEIYNYINEKNEIYEK